MTEKINSTIEYHKSTFLCGRGRCVEVAIADNEVKVRNSTKPESIVTFTHNEWKAFLLGVKNNEFEITNKD